MVRICCVWLTLATRAFTSQFAWVCVGIMMVIGLIFLTGCKPITEPERRLPAESPHPLRSGQQPAPLVTIIEKT